MNVLHICPYMHPAAGGPPVVIRQLATLAPHYGWSANVLTTSEYCEDDGSSLERKLNESFKVRVLHRDRFRLSSLASGVSGIVDESVRHSDIVHLHTLWHPFNSLARVACARYDRKFVLSPHGMLDPYSLRIKAIRKWLYLKVREKRNLLDATRLIFATPLEEQLARSSSPWIKHCEVIPLGADQPPHVPRQKLISVFNERFPWARGRRCILFLGRIHPKKGLEKILKCLPNIIVTRPEVLLVVAGTGEPVYIEFLKRQVNRTGLNQHVRFTGLLLDELKWSAFAAAEIFVLPSHQENFAIAVVEAMHMGVPVMISDNVNICSVISESSAGIVFNGERFSCEFHETVLKFLDNPEALTQMGMRGQDLARRNFTWDKTARGTFALYDQLIGRDE